MVPTCQHAEAALHGRSRTAYYYLLDGMFVGGEFCRPGKELLRVCVCRATAMAHSLTVSVSLR